MDTEEEVLRYICQKSQSGIHILSRFMEANENSMLKQYCMSKIQEYAKFKDAAEELLWIEGCTEKESRRLAEKMIEYERMNINEYQYFL